MQRAAYDTAVVTHKRPWLRGWCKGIMSNTSNKAHIRKATATVDVPARSTQCRSRSQTHGILERDATPSSEKAGVASVCRRRQGGHGSVRRLAVDSRFVATLPNRRTPPAVSYLQAAGRAVHHATRFLGHVQIEIHQSNGRLAVPHPNSGDTKRNTSSKRRGGLADTGILSCERHTTLRTSVYCVHSFVCETWPRADDGGLVLCALARANKNGSFTREHCRQSCIQEWHMHALSSSS